MNEKQWLDIRCAANDCLAECLQCEAPLTVLNDFVSSLENNGWERAVVLEVEDMILDALAIMKHTESELVVHEGMLFEGVGFHAAEDSISQTPALRASSRYEMPFTNT
jgi:hypothetical protein